MIYLKKIDHWTCLQLPQRCDCWKGTIICHCVLA